MAHPVHAKQLQIDPMWSGKKIIKILPIPKIMQGSKEERSKKKTFKK
jgi:hypothetical protein